MLLLDLPRRARTDVLTEAGRGRRIPGPQPVPIPRDRPRLGGPFSSGHRGPFSGCHFQALRNRLTISPLPERGKRGEGARRRPSPPATPASRGRRRRPAPSGRPRSARCGPVPTRRSPTPVLSASGSAPPATTTSPAARRRPGSGPASQTGYRPRRHPVEPLISHELVSFTLKAADYPTQSSSAWSVNQPAARPRPSACGGVRTDVERWRGGLPPPRLPHRRRWPSHRAAASLRGRRHRPRTPTPSSRVGLSVPTLSSGEPARAPANLRNQAESGGIPASTLPAAPRTNSTPFECCSRGTALANAPVTSPEQPEGTRRRFHAAGRCVPSSRRALTSRAPARCTRSVPAATDASQPRTRRQRPAPRLDPRDNAPLERLVEPLGRRLVGHRQQDRQRRAGTVPSASGCVPPATTARSSGAPSTVINAPALPSLAPDPHRPAASHGPRRARSRPGAHLRARGSGRRRTPDARRRKPQDEEARQGRVRRTKTGTRRGAARRGDERHGQEGNEAPRCEGHLGAVVERARRDGARELVRSGGIAAHRRGNPRQGGDETATGKKTDEGRTDGGREGGSEDGESTEPGRASARRVRLGDWRPFEEVIEGEGDRARLTGGGGRPRRGDNRASARRARTAGVSAHGNRRR